MSIEVMVTNKIGVSYTQLVPIKELESMVNYARMLGMIVELGKVG